MRSIEEIRIKTTHTFNSSIGAITKILISLPPVPQLHSSWDIFSQLSDPIPLRSTHRICSPRSSLLPSVSYTVITSTFQPIFLKLVRVAMALTA